MSCEGARTPPPAPVYESAMLLCSRVPSDDLRRRLLQQPRQATNEVLPVRVFEKHPASLDPSDDDVLQKAGKVEPWTA